MGASRSSSLAANDTNRERWLFAEAHVAAHVQRLRKERDWDYASLASRMEAVGCPIDQSAIYKIECVKPRRRITVDELIGFSKVFNVDVRELVTEPALVRNEALIELLDAHEESRRRHWDLIAEESRESDAMRRRIRDLAKKAPEEAREFVTEYFLGPYGPEAAERLTKEFLDDPLPVRRKRRG